MLPEGYKPFLRFNISTVISPPDGSVISLAVSSPQPKSIVISRIKASVRLIGVHFIKYLIYSALMLFVMASMLSFVELFSSVFVIDRDSLYGSILIKKKIRICRHGSTIGILDLADGRDSRNSIAASGIIITNKFNVAVSGIGLLLIGVLIYVRGLQTAAISNSRNANRRSFFLTDSNHCTIFIREFAKVARNINRYAVCGPCCKCNRFSTASDKGKNHPQGQGNSKLLLHDSPFNF